MSKVTAQSEKFSAQAPKAIRLNGSQARIRDAYFNHASGLFTLNSVPGSGKSVVTTDIAARTILRNYTDGDPRPAQTLTVLTFNAGEAEKISPRIANRMESLVTNDLLSDATSITDSELSGLIQQIRQSNTIGTVDSVLRDILQNIAAAVGFDSMPDVSNKLRLASIHEGCFEAVATDPANSDPFTLVEKAYPEAEYKDGPKDLLRQALTICRTRRLSTKEFIEKLHETVDNVYIEGRTERFDDVAQALHRCIGPNKAKQVTDDLSESEKANFVEADQDIYDEWRTVIDAFGTLLSKYREEYRHRIREQGVISHTDTAYLVAEYLHGELGCDDDKRERVISRYQERFRNVLIDESQDISALQHDALAPLVTEESRVFLAGDIRQSIYVWRNARPSLFAKATEEGSYFDIDWTPHETETTRVTYRPRPALAETINAIMTPALADKTRGDLTDFDMDVPKLEPDRDAADGPNVHIAGFDSDDRPGTRAYVAGADGKGEAEQLANQIANGLSAGTFESTVSTDGGDGQSVAVLFRWRTRMDTYAEEFEKRGLTVANATKFLFEAPAVTLSLDVVQWLVAPEDEDKLKRLVRESGLSLQDLEPAFEKHNWNLRALLGAEQQLSSEQRSILEALKALRDDFGKHRSQPTGRIFGAVIDELALRVDTHGLFADVEQSPAQRIANLDALTEHLRSWVDGEDGLELEDLPELLNPIREQPYLGPTQPVPESEQADVVFKTVHQAKGDEFDVVALADLGFPLAKQSPVGQRLIDSPDVLALAPPEHVAADQLGSLGPFTGLYHPDADQFSWAAPYQLDIGFRWASEHWVGESAPPHRSTPYLGGHRHLQQAVESTRAEAWRLLYVSLTRASEHLVLPLPHNISDSERQRDRWLDTIRSGLQFDDDSSSGTYSLPTSLEDSSHTVEIGVNTVSKAWDRSNTHPADIGDSTTSSAPITNQQLATHVPRFLRPSTIYPLAKDRDKHILAHLQNNPLNTDTDDVDSRLPLTLDALGAEEVGQIVHDVLTTAVDQDLPADKIREMDAEFTEIIERAINEYGPPATDSERKGLFQFLDEWILPDFVDSRLWERISDASTVYVEKPLQAYVREDGVEFEIEGQADFVIRNADGSWHVADVKVALTELNQAVQERYEVQTRVYKWLLENQANVDTVGWSIESFGAETKTITDANSDASNPIRRNKLRSPFFKGSSQSNPRDTELMGLLSSILSKQTTGGTQS